MRPSVLLWFLLVAGACTSAPATLSERARQELAAEVRAATDSLTEAMNAHDPERFQAFFDLGADFVYGTCTQFQAGGGPFASMTRAYDMAKKDAVFDVQTVSVRILAPDAAVVALQTLSSDSAASNPILTTNVLTKGTDGRWRVVHQHQSWPGCPQPKRPHPMTTLEDQAGNAEVDTIG